MATPSSPSCSPLDEETVKKVIRQVEYYFGDSSLPRDDFLRKTISESEDGMVSLALICSFSRMRTHLNLEDIKAEEVQEDTVQSVAATLRKSTFLKISEDGKKVGRVTELPKPEEVIEQLDAKTISASPFPYDAKLEDVQSFFGQYGTVNSVRLPRHVADNKLFCGSVLVEFSTEEDAEKILKQNLVHAGANLELSPKTEFDAERVKLAEKFKDYRPSNNRKNNSNAEPNYPKGLIVAFKLKSTKAGGSAENNGEEIDGASLCKLDGELDSTEKNNNGEKNDEIVEESIEKEDEKNGSESIGKETDDEEKPSEKLLKGDEKEEKPKAASYIGNMDVVMREDLKAVFKKFGAVMFIDFKIGEESGYVRFEEPEAAQKASAAAVLAHDGGLTVKNFVATLEPVTGEAEQEYWSLLRGIREKHRDSFKGNHRGRGGKFNRGGGRHFDGKRGRSRDNNNSDSGRSNKAQKVV